MLFNSFDFLVFAPIAIVGATLLRGWGLKAWLVVLSYIFYGWASPAYVLLLAASTVIDFFVAQRVHQCETHAAKRRWLLVSVFGNLGMLGVFNYTDFVIGTVNGLTGSDHALLHLYLPAGISFYTFQTMSYTIDVYRGKMTPTRNFLTMAAYVSFFPQLVAGPIERAQNLMPQLDTKQPRSTEDVFAGVSRILWGLTKKVVFADWLSEYARWAYANPNAGNAWELALATYCFAFVIYLDFSAYSDIAIGTARCMGVRLRENFKHPYLARNASEFWRRWHISLSEWLRDYLYIPLGGSRKGTPRTFFNVTVVMFLGGLWHGADWAFVLWGLWHGLGLVVFHAWSLFKPRLGFSTEEPGPTPRLRDVPAVLLTFHFVWFSWVLFAAGSIDTALAVLRTLFTEPWGEPAFRWMATDLWRIAGFLAVAVLAHIIRGMGWTDRWTQARQPWLIGAFWGALIVMMALLFAPSSERFIYFQF